MARLVSRADFARMAGVSAMAITKACRSKLAAADSDGRIDVAHPAAQEYLRARGVDPTALSATPPTRAPLAAQTRPRPPADEPAEAPRRAGGRPKVELDGRTERGMGTSEATDYLKDLGDRVRLPDIARWTLQRLTEKYGTAQALKDYLEARLKIASLDEKEIKNKEHLGELIVRDFVKMRVFGYLEETNRRLLQDLPKTVARQLYAQARAGVPIEEAEKGVRVMLAAQLKQLKSSLTRALGRVTDEQ
jgi:hypothetical protein